MAESRKRKVDGEGTGAGSPLAQVFPGETVTLSTGDVITVVPWGARAVIREVPALLGRLFAKLIPLQGLQVAQPGWIEENLPAALTSAGAEIWEIVRFSADLDEDMIDKISSEDLLILAEAVLQANKGFFARFVSLRDRIKTDLAGFASRPPSSVPASGSTS